MSTLNARGFKYGYKERHAAYYALKINQRFRFTKYLKRVRLLLERMKRSVLDVNESLFFWSRREAWIRFQNQMHNSPIIKVKRVF